MPSFLEREQLVPMVPYQTPVDQILQVFGTAQNLYAQGAGRLKNALNTYSTMELTRGDNRAQLQSSLEQSKSDLQKASLTNLGVGDNQTMAMSSFDPITKNQDLMGDYALTKGFSSQRSRAEADRINNGGKDYNQSSVDAINFQQQLFAMDPNKGGAWRTYYNDLENYQHYYDKTGELEKLLKMFKTDVIEKDGTSGDGYIISEKNGSWYKDKWQQFVEANASPQLKNQLAIEARADYRKGMVMYKDRPQELYSLYNDQFKQMKEAKISGYNQSLNEATIKLSSLSKNDPKYAELKALYEQKIQGTREAIAGINSAKDVDPRMVDINNQTFGESTAASLYSHKYFDQIGSAFAHQDIKQSIKMDGAYWANKNLEARFAEMKQDANQFQATMDYKYTALKQDRELEEQKFQNQLALQGMKLNAKGQAVPIGQDFRTNEVTQAGLEGKDLGKSIYDEMNQVISNGAALAYDGVQSNYFNNEELLKSLAANPDTRFDRISTAGGMSKDTKEEIKSFIADGYYGSDLYKNLGIDISGDPETAKSKLKSALDLVSGARIKQLLNNGFNNQKIFDLAMSKIGKDKGAKVRAELEIANGDWQSTLKGYNERYGGAVAEALSKVGYPSYVSPDSDLYKRGVRGYEQEQGESRIPTEAEFTAFAKYNSEKTPSKGQLSQYDRYFPGSPTMGAGYIYKDDGGKSWQGLVNKYKNTLYEVLGKEGAVGLNAKGNITTITEGKEGNRGPANEVMASIVNSLDEGNNEKSKDFAALITRNYDAVRSYTIFSDGVTGKPKVQFQLDANKLNEDDRKLLPKDYDKIRLSSSSELIDQRFRVTDKAYQSLLTMPRSATLDYMIPGTALGTTEGPTRRESISIKNKGNYNTPKFELEASWVVPRVNQTGDFLRDAQGKLILERMTPKQVERYLDNYMQGQYSKNLQLNPGRVYDIAIRQAHAMKALIQEIAENNYGSSKDVPKEFLDEINSLVNAR